MSAVLLLGCQNISGESSGGESNGGQPIITNTIQPGDFTRIRGTDVPALPAAQRCTQDALNAMTDPVARFTDAFECGDTIFSAPFNEIDGVGANVDGKKRFTRVPRADATGAGQWASHTPARATGPNAQSCGDCHRSGTADGAGPISDDQSGEYAADGHVGGAVAGRQRTGEDRPRAESEIPA